LHAGKAIMVLTYVKTLQRAAFRAGRPSMEINACA
jgi:hypothetical protein